MKIKINYPDHSYTVTVGDDAEIEADGLGTITIEDGDGNEIGEFYGVEGYFLERE